MARKNILDAILEALPAIGEGLQQAGVGVSAIEGRSTDAQTVAALETIQKLKKGRLDAQSQKEMAVEFEKMIRQENVQKKITQTGSEFSTTVSTPESKPLFVYDPTTNTFSPAGNVPSGSQIVQRKEQQPLRVHERTPEGGLREVATLPPGSRIVSTPKVEKTGIQAFTETQLIDIVKGGDEIPEEQRNVAKKELAKRLGVPEKESKPGGLIDRFMEIFKTAGTTGLGASVTRQTPNQRNAKIIDRIQQLRRTMTDQQIADSLRQKGIDPKLYGLNG